MNEQEIFDRIKAFYDDEEEARAEAKHIISLPEKDQLARYDFVRTRITKAGMRFVIKVLALEKEGKYKEAILLKVKHVNDMTLEEAVKQTKWGRIISKHRISVGGSYDSGKLEYHWPHCKCGWEGARIYGKESYWRADKVKCPHLLASLKAKNLPEEL